jgi:hypothetical protein
VRVAAPQRSPQGPRGPLDTENAFARGVRWQAPGAEIFTLTRTFSAETEGFEPSVPVRGLHLSRVKLRYAGSAHLGRRVTAGSRGLCTSSGRFRTTDVHTPHTPHTPRTSRSSIITVLGMLGDPWGTLGADPCRAILPLSFRTSRSNCRSSCPRKTSSGHRTRRLSGCSRTSQPATASLSKATNDVGPARVGCLDAAQPA